MIEFVLSFTVSLLETEPEETCQHLSSLPWSKFLLIIFACTFFLFYGLFLSIPALRLLPRHCQLQSGQERHQSPNACQLPNNLTHATLPTC